MTRTIIWIIVAISQCAMLARANGISTRPDETTFPGNAIKIDDATKSADLVVVGVVDSSVVGDPSASGTADYTISVTLAKILKGAEQRKQVFFDVRVESYKGETAPNEKTAYIFFLKAGPEKSYSFIKMLTSTDKNIDAVTKMIAQNATTQSAELFPGNAIKIDDATKSADLVVVGVVDSSVVGDPSASGTADYTISVTLAKILKGAEQRKQVFFDVRVESYKGETAPNEKTAYIFFLKAGPEKSYSFIKMLTSTDKNIDAVTKMIAQNATTQSAELFPGNAIKIDDATKSADLVVVGVVDSSVVGDPSASGTADYTISVTLAKILKGAEQRKQVFFDVRVESYKGETAPNEKTAYIFFLKAGLEKSYSFIKMLTSTDKNIDAVTKMIAQNAATHKSD